MLGYIRRRQQGDTIVEVLLATVVISIVIMGAYALTNRATRINQTAIERTTATNMVRQQIEFIRGMHTYGRTEAAWQEIEDDYAATNYPSYTNCEPTSSNDAFAVNTAGSYDDADTVADYDFDADNGDLYKVWAEAYLPPSGDYVDIHVRACWQGLGSTGELGTQRSVSVLRLSL